MIGGCDIVVDMPNAPDRRDEVIALAVRVWPHAVIEDADTGGPITKTTRWVFVYRDEASFISIEAHGVTEENGPAFVHLIFDTNEITCVVEDENDVASDAMIIVGHVRALAAA